MVIKLKDIKDNIAGISTYGNLQNPIYEIRRYKNGSELRSGVLYAAEPDQYIGIRDEVSFVTIPSLSFDAIFSEIEYILRSDYQRTEQLVQLNEMVRQNAEVSEIAILCRKILGNPVWILDADMRIIEHSISPFKAPSALLPKDTVVSIRMSYEILEPDSSCPYSRSIGKITDRNRTIGYLIVMNIENAFGNIRQSEYLRSVCIALSGLYELTNTSSKNASAFFFADILEGRLRDSETIKQCLKSLNIAEGEKYYVLTIERTEQEQMMPYNTEIERLLHQVIYKYGRFYVSIYPCKAGKRLSEKDFPQLVAFLRQQGMKMAISNGFKELNNINNAFMQTLEIFRLNPIIISRGSSFLKYDDYTLSNLFKIAYNDGFPLLGICDPAVLSLFNHDKENDTDYFRTLAVFLLSGLNYSAAANHLFVHRNTVYKRIDWIIQQYGLDLDSQAEIDNLKLSLKVLEYLNIVDLSEMAKYYRHAPDDNEVQI